MWTFEDIKNTRYFQQVAEESRQEGKLEGKLERVAGLLQLRLTVEQIARALQLDIAEVRKIANQRSNNSDN